jgi:hypothetical protein
VADKNPPAQRRSISHEPHLVTKRYGHVLRTPNRWRSMSTWSPSQKRRARSGSLPRACEVTPSFRNTLIIRRRPSARANRHTGASGAVSARQRLLAACGQRAKLPFDRLSGRTAAWVVTAKVIRAGYAALSTVGLWKRLGCRLHKISAI